MLRRTVLTTIKLVLLVSPLLITGQAVSQALPTATLSLAIGMTVASTGTTYVYSTPSTSPPAIGVEAQGNQGTVIGGPESAELNDMVASLL